MIGPAYGYGGYSSYSYRSGFGFSVGGPRVRVSGFAGGFVSRSAFVAPLYGPVAPFGPYGPIGFAPVAPFGFGPVFGPPVIVVQPIIVAGNFGLPEQEPENMPLRPAQSRCRPARRRATSS